MISEPPSWIGDILEQHVEDLGVLWSQRRDNSGLPSYTRRSFIRADARILAHLDALILAGDDALPFLFPALTADYGGAVTATLALLQGNASAHAEQILEALKAAGGPVLDGLSDAMSWAPAAAIRTLKDVLLTIARSGSTPQAAVVAGILGAHNAVLPRESPLDSLLAQKDATVRFYAWRACRGIAAPRGVPLYQAGMNDPDPVVRAEALSAAAWAAQRPVLSLCRAAAQKPSVESVPLLNLLAVLAEPADVPIFMNLAKLDGLGPARFDIMARSGFPAMAPLLLAAMKNKDAATAAAAGLAFAHLTNFDPSTGQRVSLAQSQDPMEQAFAEEVPVPDAAAAEAFWKKEGSNLTGLQRISRGMPADPALPPAPAILPKLDCRGYLDVHLRHFFQTGAARRPLDLLAFSLTPLT